MYVKWKDIFYAHNTHAQFVVKRWRTRRDQVDKLPVLVFPARPLGHPLYRWGNFHHRNHTSFSSHWNSNDLECKESGFSYIISFLSSPWLAKRLLVTQRAFTSQGLELGTQDTLCSCRQISHRRNFYNTGARWKLAFIAISRRRCDNFNDRWFMLEFILFFRLSFSEELIDRPRSTFSKE